jgi:2-polyprenyl-3-methyl-5-hydroxy-6-metoxy-1,4-benzoquinol methylase
VAVPSFLQRLLARLAADEAVRERGSWELPADPALRREAAAWAYRSILLRNPESRQALDHLAGARTARAMRDLLLNSPEARGQSGFPVTASMTGDEPAQPVQVDVSAEEREALFRRVQAVWHALGEERPHWSVVTADSFRPENIDGTLESFYASGTANVATVLRTLERNGIERARLRRCMDFGCGVGRLTAALAPHFEEVVGVDVSASHLEVARDVLAKRGIRNVSWRALEAIEDVGRLPSVDLVVSLIVLQHNPPPVMRLLLEGLLGRLAPGGAAVIQLPTYLPAGYAFDARAYLQKPSEGMEMHALPQREVFAAARAAGVEVLEALEDLWTGYGAGSRSNTFVMRRPA